MRYQSPELARMEIVAPLETVPTLSEEVEALARMLREEAFTLPVAVETSPVEVFVAELSVSPSSEPADVSPPGLLEER